MRRGIAAIQIGRYKRSTYFAYDKSTKAHRLSTVSVQHEPLRDSELPRVRTVACNFKTGDTTFTRVLQWTTSFVRSQSRENVKGTADGFIELYLDTYGEASDTWEIFDVTPPCDDALL